MARRARRGPGALERGVLLDSYDKLCHGMSRWRSDPDLFEARKQVLSFVVGLRFSALLIYGIRKLLEGTGLQASWGTILADDGETCSPECDIIVHEGGRVATWNGGDAVGCPVMEFCFINRSNVRLVISCKGQELDDIDEEVAADVRKLRPFVDRIWLFAECCKEGKLEALEEKSKKKGYERFWYVYRRTTVGQLSNEEGWLEFGQSLRTLATRRRRRSSPR